MVKPDQSAVSGDAVGTHTMDAKEYQAIVRVGADGHIIDSKDVYGLIVPNQVHVASANNPAWDLWNGDAAKLVRVLSIKHQPDIVTAVTGVAISWLLERTTAIGTGGTALTPWLPDLSQTAHDTDITARSKPSGGATAGTDLFPYQLHSEETNTGTMQIAAQGGLELVPEALRLNRQGILLRPSQGIRVTQVTSSSVGSSGWVIVFSVE